MDQESVKQSIAELSTEIQSMHSEMYKLQVSRGEPSSFVDKIQKMFSQQRMQQQQQRHAVSVDIVRSVVSEAFQTQQEVNAGNITLIVVGFPEEGNGSSTAARNVRLLGLQM